MTGRRLTSNEFLAVAKRFGWAGDLGGTVIVSHRRTLARVSLDYEEWEAGIDALLRLAVEVAKADAEARKRQP